MKKRYHYDIVVRNWTSVEADSEKEAFEKAIKTLKHPPEVDSGDLVLTKVEGKMSLKISLKDPKYCDGCPLLDDIESYGYNYHSRFYQGYCKFFKQFVGERKKKLGWKYHIARPDICMEKNKILKENQKQKDNCSKCVFIRDFGRFRSRVRQAISEKGLYLNLCETDETIIQELRKLLGLSPKEKKVTKKDIKRMKKFVDAFFKKKQDEIKKKLQKRKKRKLRDEKL